MSSEPNGKRKRVFLTLVEDDGELTPSEISERVGETRQAVKYHLDELVDRGLVVRDDGHYRCQPVFTDDGVKESVGELISRFKSMSEGGLHSGQANSASRAEVMVNNMLMGVTLSQNGPKDDLSFGVSLADGVSQDDWKDVGCKLCGQTLPEALQDDSRSISNFCSHSCWAAYSGVGEEYPSMWPQVREVILQRDGYQCWACGLPEGAAQVLFDKSLPIHHVNKVKSDCRPGNLLTLCLTCHGRLEDTINT